MDYIKKLIGLVAGVFCVLVVAWLCSYCLKIDFKWYLALNKPQILPSGGYFTFFVAITYMCVVGVIARLVTGKHIFPSMIFLAFTGLFSVLFIYAFFTLKNIYLAFAFSILLLAFSLVVQIRFFLKEVRIALYYLPAFLFNVFCFFISAYIAFNN